MPQRIHTKKYGPIDFVRTWASAEGGHVGLLVVGGYAHLSGHPVTQKEHLETLIPAGSHLDAALEWWENKDKPTESERSIMLRSDGSYSWNDGTEIENAADVMTVLPVGTQLDAVLTWFYQSKVLAVPPEEEVKPAKELTPEPGDDEQPEGDEGKKPKDLKKKVDDLKKEVKTGKTGKEGKPGKKK